MRIATCQLPETRGDVPAALALVRAYTQRAAAEGARLVCFPECFLQGYDLDPPRVAEAAVELRGAKFAAVLEELAAFAPVVVLGLIEREGEALYNTAVALERGRVVARYRKMNLLAPERAIFTAGQAPVVFAVDGIGVGINICNDLRSPAIVERTVQEGAHVLACPCSNLLPLAAAEEWRFRHHEIRAGHAVRHGVWIVSADIVGAREGSISYGPSAIIDPLGYAVAEVPPLTAGLVVADLAVATELPRRAR